MFFFKPTFTLQARYIFIKKCEKDEKPQVHFKHPLILNSKKCNISSTYNLHKGYKIDYDICLNSHEST